jgi:TonB-linked SusC/RagA family outer membrane protein
MKLKIYILIAILTLGAERVLAQAAVVTGKVTEMVNGRAVPVPGANVIIMNEQERTLRGVVADGEGNYRLSIPANEGNLSLVFAFIGMESQTFRYTGQSTINATLKPSENVIDDVVVTARQIIRNDMGISQKEQVTATQRVDMDAIMATSPVNTIEEALQGRLGGVDIISGGGDPGARSSIRIRGTSTLTSSSEPLIVVDGVPYKNEIDSDFDFSTATDEGIGALLNISPDDIESIEVLKDAASTAIWGTKGGGGVLMINLKKGAKGRTTFSFSTKLSARFEPATIPMLNGNQYTALMQDAIWNSANYRGLGNSTQYLELLFDTPAIGYDPAWDRFQEYNQNTDWLAEIRQTGMVWDNNFSMNGGGDKASYRFSLGQLTDNGTTISTQMQRVNTSLDVDYQFSNKLRFGALFRYTQTGRDAPALESARGEAFRKMPNKSPYWIDDITGQRTDRYFSEQIQAFEGVFAMEDNKWDKAKNYNPIAMIREGMNKTQQREGNVTFRLEYRDILPGLRYTGYVSMMMRTTKERRFLPQEATGVVWTDPFANLSVDSMNDNLSIQTENKLQYFKNWNGVHNIVANAVFRTEQGNSSSYGSQTFANGSAELSDPIVGASVAGIDSGESESRSASATFLLNYTLLDRYVVQGSMTMEGNSAMGRSNRTGYFPMVGVSWNMQEENFLKDKEWIDEVKLRASYGLSGKAPKKAGMYLGAFTSSGQYMDMDAIAPIRPQLDKLKWETSRELNLGFDLSFFTGKLKLTFDRYTKTTSDLLREDYKIPSSTGYASISSFNSGKVLNRGVEFRADVVLFENRDWRIASWFNLSRNVNEVLSLPGNMIGENYSFKNGNYAVLVEEGRPVGSFYGYRYQGVFQNKEQTYARDAEGGIMNNASGEPIVMRNGTAMVFPGDAQYEDINHDGVINEYDIVYLGNYMPVLTGGVGVNIRWKQWMMNVLLHTRVGNKIINETRLNNESMYGPNNQSTATLRRWRNEGDDTEIPRALWNEGFNYLGSDRFVEDASFLRLKEVSLTYQIPKKLLDRWGMNQLSVYVTGYDLFTWTNYTGQDPEVNPPGKPTDLLRDTATTPIARRLTCGIRMNF